MCVRLTLAVALVASCNISVDLGSGPYRCSESPQSCPQGRVCVGGVCVSPGPDAGADAAFSASFRRQLTIAAGFDGVATDVPVMVILNPERIDYQAAAGGAKLAFRDQLGEAIPHEIEKWSPQGESRVWLRVPLLEASTTLFMIYGGEPSGSNSLDVWSDYGAAFHFEDGFFNSSNGTDDVVIEGGARTGPGRLGEGLPMDGIDDAVDLGPSQSLFSGATGATVSAWVNTAGIGNYAVIEYSNSAATSSRVLLNISNLVPGVGVLTDDGAANTERLNGPAIAADQWTWVLGTADLLQSEMRIFINGELAAEQALVVSATSFPATDSALAAIGRNETALAGYFEGALDEVHAASVSVTDAVVRAQYASMTDSLFSFGVEEVLSR